MKKISLYLAIALFVFTSCEMDTNKFVDSEDNVCIALNIGGEISTQEMPLTKAISSNDLLGIVVQSGTSPFAAGLFDNAENLRLNLKKGGTYRIRCALIKNGKNTVSKDENGSYLSPFGFTSVYNRETSRWGTALRNYFGYINGTPDYYYMKHSGWQFDGYNALSESNIAYDGYFSEITDYKPSVDGTIAVDLVHTSIGVKYKVSGLTDGSLNITIKRDDSTLIDARNVSSNGDGDDVIFHCSDVYSAWKYKDTYKETLTVSVSWLRGIGITQDLGSVNVDVLRNKMNIININLSSEENIAGIGVSLENTEMTKEDLIIEAN